MDKVGKFYRSIDVELPRRSTPGSAGYDFYAPHDIVIPAGSSVQFNTGVCVNIVDGWVLMLFPRSSLGMKGIRIANTTGIIDSDYTYPIGCKLVNDSEDDISIRTGERYMQGIFLQYGITEDDEPVNKGRKGGMGSTGK
ncbi:MAG: deoxyuridine 5'-triphosphate nucleotidohydrolase [Erysipelotrichaceae bacterium]|nr:deoxyuridine 5'-triphosphate nucleotidohydrolase [Erysipelotrichaceae bacterium]